MDADAEITEPEEHSLDPYDILRDDPFALIPPGIVDRWDAKQNQPPHHMSNHSNTHTHTHTHNHTNPWTP